MVALHQIYPRPRLQTIDIGYMAALHSTVKRMKSLLQTGHGRIELSLILVSLGTAILY